MAHAFKTIPAKPTFGTLTKVGYQSDYISNKKANLLYCNNRDKTNCNKLTKSKVSNYANYNLFYTGRYLNAVNNGCVLPFNKTNLIAGQYSKMNLTDVCTVSKGSPCPIDNDCSGCSEPIIIDSNSSEPFYQEYTIDPLGLLFGKSTCGINNFTKYMVYKPN
jgi:hypothetical protein